jgi:polyisoprenoid-binding protein YceI
MFGLNLATKTAIVLTPVMLGLAAADFRMNLHAESKLWVEGTSTVRSFKCEADVVEADIATTRADAATALLGGTKAVNSVTMRVPAASLDCNNGTMNSHMLKALKAETAPVISFRLGTYDLLEANTKVNAAMVGKLTLGGVTKDVAVNATLEQEAPGVVRLKGMYELNMKEYGLKPPTLMMGTMKVGEVVKVHFDLLLKD